MSDFVSNLISRHMLPDSNVKPRLRSRFEPERSLPTPFTNDIVLEKPPCDTGSSAADTTQNQSITKPMDTFGPDTPTAHAEPPSASHHSDESPIRGESSTDPTSPDSYRLETGRNPEIPLLTPLETVHSMRQPGRSEPLTERGQVAEEGQRTKKTINQPVIQPSGEPRLEAHLARIDWPVAIPGQAIPSSLVSWPAPPDEPAEKATAPELKTSRQRVKPDKLATEEKAVQPSSFTPERQTQSIIKPVTPARYLADSDWEGERSQSGGLLDGTVHLPNFFSTGIVNGAAPEPNDQPQPIIKVTIGRIDVRAVSPPATPKPQAKAEPKPLLSLEDYLKQRNSRHRN